MSTPSSQPKFFLSRVTRVAQPTVPNITVAFCIAVFIVHLRLGNTPVIPASFFRVENSAPKNGCACDDKIFDQDQSKDHTPVITQTIFDTDLAANARRDRPLPTCADGPARTFLMVFMGHSGSSAILSEIRRHPNVYVEKMELVDHEDTANASEALLSTREFFKRGLKLGKIPGFKIRPNHILTLPTEFHSLLRDFDTRIIWQYRQNLFKASVGEYAARYLNDTRAVEGLRQNLTDAERCKEGAGCSFPIEDMSYLHHIMKEKVRSHHLISKAVDLVSGSVRCVREIPYEDYLYDREATMRDIIQFLGIPYFRTDPERFKATGDNMCTVVQNWDEVCKAFYGCITWQHMLDDARNQCFCQYTTGPISFCDAHIS